MSLLLIEASSLTSLAIEMRYFLNDRCPSCKGKGALYDENTRKKVGCAHCSETGAIRREVTHDEFYSWKINQYKSTSRWDAFLHKPMSTWDEFLFLLLVSAIVFGIVMVLFPLVGIR